MTEARQLGKTALAVGAIVARYGFQDRARTCRCWCGKSPLPVEDRDRPDRRAGMPAWRERLFLAAAHAAADAVDYFKLPRHRTVLLGSTIEI